jgi:Flp pilus assembly protein TadD
MRPTVRAKVHLARLVCSAALLAGIATAMAGCQTLQLGETTAAAPQDSLPIAAAGNGGIDARRDLDAYGQQYRADPSNVDKALQYAQALRRAGQRAQAVAVLEKASMERPRDRAVLGAYGRALAEAGNYDQALDVLDRAHTPDQPDWHILSAQGAVLDQMGRHADAQRYYLTALKIAPDEPSILSNLGLSYALSKNLREAEATLRRAAAHTPVDPRRRPAGPFRRSRNHRPRRPAARGGRRQRRLSAADARPPQGPARNDTERARGCELIRRLHRTGAY